MKPEQGIVSRHAGVDLDQVAAPERLEPCVEIGPRVLRRELGEAARGNLRPITAARSSATAGPGQALDARGEESVVEEASRRARTTPVSTARPDARAPRRGRACERSPRRTGEALAGRDAGPRVAGQGTRAQDAAGRRARPWSSPASSTTPSTRAPRRPGRPAGRAAPASAHATAAVRVPRDQMRHQIEQQGLSHGGRRSRRAPGRIVARAAKQPGSDEEISSRSAASQRGAQPLSSTRRPRKCRPRAARERYTAEPSAALHPVVGAQEFPRRRADRAPRSPPRPRSSRACPQEGEAGGEQARELVEEPRLAESGGPRTTARRARRVASAASCTSVEPSELVITADGRGRRQCRGSLACRSGTIRAGRLDDPEGRAQQRQLDHVGRRGVAYLLADERLRQPAPPTRGARRR